MSIAEAGVLSGLANGESLTEIAARSGAAVTEVQRVWQDLLRRKLPSASASLTGTVGGSVEILRDSYGVPHIFADGERDLFFGLGFAMAQDRLWQMDFVRRK